MPSFSSFEKPHNYLPCLSQVIICEEEESPPVPIAGSNWRLKGIRLWNEEVNKGMKLQIKNQHHDTQLKPEGTKFNKFPPWLHVESLLNSFCRL